MALLDDIFQGNMLTAVVVGLGAVLLAPLAGPVLRPAAKAAIKGAMVAYQAVAELGEAVGDMVAEVQHEWGEAETEAAGRPPTSRSRSKPGKPDR
jgi:hypothetical protein